MKLFLKIVGFLMVFFLIVALILALIGIEKINFDDTYYQFLTKVAYSYQQWELKIPSIPKIDLLSTDTPSWWEAILNAFINFANGLFSFLNVIIMIINYVIQLIQFISTFLFVLFEEFPQILSENGYHPII